MTFSFYDQLSRENKIKYDRMLETHYILTRCDEFSFIETDENDNKSLSSTFLLSLQNAKRLWDMDPSYYPQGSISGNRQNYEAIRNYWGGTYPQEHEYNLFRKGIKNFLRLRTDDSGLFGSSYKTEHTTSGKEIRKYRKVEVSLRHTASGLWISLEEFQSDAINDLLKKSIDAFLVKANAFAEKKGDWHNDVFRHSTIASISKTCDTIISKFPKEEDIINLAKEVGNKSLGLLFEDECCEESMYGELRWKMPDVKEQKIVINEYYLDLFALSMIPKTLNDAKTQLVVKTIINNRVPSDHGYGIPIHPISTHGKLEDMSPDFGASSAVLYLLWFSIENNLGGKEWQDYCRENFRWLLDFCISAFDKSQYYLLPYCENNSKVLFLPKFADDKKREETISDYIAQVKKEVYRELTQKNGKLHKNLESISCPDGMNHIVTLIDMWKVPKYWKELSNWTTEKNSGSILDLTGQFLNLAGQFAGGVLKSLSS